MPTAHEPRRLPGRGAFLSSRGPAARARSAALAFGLAALGAGCNGCPKAKPYTPYTLDDAAAPAGDAGAPAVDASADAEPAEAGVGFTGAAGLLAPGDGKVWPLGAGASVSAPAGRVFAVGLVLDLDGDGTPDLLAFARAPDGLRGELLFASGRAPDAPRTVAAIPAGLSVPGCSARASIGQVGARTLAFDFEPHCPPRLREEAARWVAVLRQAGPGEPAKGPELALELRIGALPEDELLHLGFDPRDRDGDGRDDLAVTLALSGAPRPLAAVPTAAPVSVSLAFLDRPAGLSRDPAEPEGWFAAAASARVPGARRKARAADAGAGARALRRLHALLCEEEGAPRIATSGGTIPCGDGRALDDAAYAEALAAATIHDPARALAVRLDGPRGKELARLLAKVAPDAPASILHRIDAVPTDAPLATEALRAPPGAGARWTPFAFEASGDLLVRTAAGPTRVDPKTFAETAAAGVAPWPSIVAWSAGTDAGVLRLVSVDQACRAPTMTARLVAALRALPAEHVEGDPFSVPLPLLPLTDVSRLAGRPRTAGEAHRCRDAQDLRATPIDLIDSGVLLSVAGEAVALDASGAASPVPTVCTGDVCSSLGPPGPRRALGAARSPDGATVALPTERGVLVLAAGKAHHWTGEGLERATACVPSNGGTRLACLSAGRGVLYEKR